MWFKNLQLYRFTSPFTHSAEELAEKLQAGAFQACGKRDLSQYGWVAPLGANFDELVHAANGYVMICAKKEEKVMPAGAIKEMVDNKAAAIELEEDRKLYRKERETLKEEIIFDSLPNAFTRSSRTFAYIDAKNGWLVVDAASPKKAEELCSYLRETLGSLPVVPPQVIASPTVVMTQWLRDENIPEDLLLGDECELRESLEDGSILRCKRQDLSAEEVTAHLDAGKQAYKVAIDWSEKFTAILNDDLTIKRLKFDDTLLAEADDDGADDAAAKFDADFAIMTLTLAGFLPRLLEYFEGEKIPV